MEWTLKLLATRSAMFENHSFKGTGRYKTAYKITSPQLASTPSYLHNSSFVFSKFFSSHSRISPNCFVLSSTDTSSNPTSRRSCNKKIQAIISHDSSSRIPRTRLTGRIRGVSDSPVHSSLYQSSDTVVVLGTF